MCSYKISTFNILIVLLTVHDEPRPPHSCFAKQNLRRKIFTGVGLTKERSVMKYLNHFTSLACWISGWTPTTISRYTWCELNRKSIDSSLCGPNTWGSPWAKLRRCGNLFSGPGRHKIVCGGKIEETFKAFDRRWLADLPEWSGIEECCWSSADGWLLFSPTRIVRAHCDVSLHEWVNLPHLSDVRVHAALETYVCMSPSQILSNIRLPLASRARYLEDVHGLVGYCFSRRSWSIYAIDDRQRSTQCWVSYENIRVVCITLLPPILMIWKIVAIVYHINEIIGRQIDFRV